MKTSVIQFTVQPSSQLDNDFDFECDSLLRRRNKVQTSSGEEAVVNCQTQDAKVLNTYYIF